MDRGVFIVGPSRSGTSMVAGCIGVQGMFWTGPMKQKSHINPKGFWESIYFPVGSRINADVPFKTFMRQHAYTGGPWMVKAGPEAWPIIRPLEPLVVRVWRPKRRILESRNRISWGKNQMIVEKAWERMRDMEKEAKCFDAYADEVAAGNFLVFHELFAEMGLEFDEQRAMKWVEPELFSK